MLQSRFGILTLLLFLFFAFFLFRINQIGGLNASSYATTTAVLDREAPSYRINSYLNNLANEILPYPQNALLSGIILGNKTSLPFTLKQELIKTSTIHIVVVSGENLSLLASFILVLTPFLGRKKTIVLILLSVLGFTYLTNFQVPVIRAAIMISLSFLAMLLGKEKETPWILGLSAMVMLIFDPNLIFSVSFQLSFLATAGVVLLSPGILKALAFVPEIIREDLAVTIAAEGAIIPVIASNFHQISLAGIIVNTLVLWTILPVMLSGIACLGLAAININLGAMAATFPNALLTYFLYIVRFFAGWPLSQIQVADFSPVIWIGYYVLLLSVFFLPKRPQVVSEPELC